MMLPCLCSVFALFCHQSFAFQPLLDSRSRKTCKSSEFGPELDSKQRICLFYKSERDSASDDTSLTHCSTPSSLTLPIDDVLSTPELWSQDWHDSFVRNGLVDFVPPLSSHLNCLLVGGSEHHAAESNSAPSTVLKASQQIQQEENEKIKDKNHVMADEITPFVVEGSLEQALEANNVDEQQAMLIRLFGKLDVHTAHHEDSTDLDCILDRGLMDELVTTNKDRDVGLLLLEATRHLREHGVYIVVTSTQLTDEMKDFLVNVGTLLGMQWRFDLDGISNDYVTVSVARKYFTGELPTAGKLATVKRAMP